MKKLLLLMTLVLASNVYASPDEDALLTQILALQSMQLPNLATEVTNLQMQLQDLQGITHLHINTEDFATWGNDAADWQSLLNTANNGGSSSDLGVEVTDLASQFPIDSSQYDAENHSKTAQKLYKLRADTTLAARAASQLDFNKLQQQIDYQHQLQSKIPMMLSVKQSVDLQNRLQAENNLIQLELLRQAAINNQQVAVANQGKVTADADNVKFLSH